MQKRPSSSSQSADSVDNHRKRRHPSPETPNRSDSIVKRAVIALSSDSDTVNTIGSRPYSQSLTLLFQMNPGTPIETTQKETPSPKTDIDDMILISKKSLAALKASNDELQNDLDELVTASLKDERRLKSEVTELKARLYDKGEEISRLQKELQDTRELLEEIEDTREVSEEMESDL
jgi:hypothetical protein